MVNEPLIRVALAGSGDAAEEVRRILEQVDAFEVVPVGGVRSGGTEVIVIAHTGGVEPRAELAAAREHSGAPVVVATSTPTSALVRWAIGSDVADVLPLPATPAQAMFVVEKAARAAAQQEQRARGAKVVTVFSPKGGSGKSVASTNLAVAAATHANSRTLLVDLDLQFGDAAIMLGLSPHSTVRELLGTPSELDAEKLEVYTERHSSGVSVLPAPMNPEDAELIGEAAVRALLTVARESNDLVVVDTAPFFYGPMLATLDQTDELLVICNPDVPTLKNVRLTLKTLELLSFPEDRLRIVLNRASSASGMERGDVEAALDRSLDFVLPLDPSVPLAVNAATPPVLQKGSPFSEAMLEVARTVCGGDWSTVENRQTPKVSWRLSFGRS